MSLSAPAPAPTPTPSPADETRRRRAEFWEPIAVRGVAVAAVFVAAVVILLAWHFAHRLVKDPLDSAEFKDLKQQLVDLKKQEPSEEVQQQIAETIDRIRVADLELRAVYFRQRRLAARGAWLLLAGVAVLALAAKSVATLRRRIPSPQPQPAPRDLESPRNAVVRAAVITLGGVLVGLAIGLSLGIHSDLGDLEKDTKEEIARNWPYFRGPGGLGISAYDNAPTAWDVESGKEIVWKTPVPLEGNSSPIVWNDRVFLTGATEQKREVYCFSTADGKLLWQKEAPGTPASTATVPKVLSDTGFAAPTPATDGRRVYAGFANGDLAAFDFTGKLAWSKSLGIPKNDYGHGTSLAMCGKLLLVQYDQGIPKERLSKLIALDGATGKPVWETPRPEMVSSWSTPIVIEFKGRQQIITAGDPWAIGYAPDGGKELWRAKCLRQDVAPSPVFADGIVYFGHNAPYTSAIRPDGQGDVTETHVLWKAEDNLPDTCSPLATPQWVFLLTSSGTLTCYDAKSGKKLKDKDFDSSFQASPSLANKNLYLFGAEGKVFLLGADPASWGKTVAETDMKEPCAASPAFQNGRIYVRTKSQLICIGKK